MTRYITKRNLPTEPHVCIQPQCVYMVEGQGMCQDPRNNRGNSDAWCHGKPARKVLSWLKRNPSPC